MSISIRFYDANDTLTTFIANEGETFEQILGHDDVQEWFDNSDADCDDEIVNCISSINGADVEGNDTVIEIMLRATAQNDDEISFNFVVDNDENEDFDATINREGNGATAAGASGVVIVSIAGGLQTARINITNGTTTLRDVIFNDTVRARSGMSDAQLSEATIQYKGTCYSGQQLSNVHVNDADIIELAPRVAATKG